MKIALDVEKEAMLDEFAQSEKPGAVKMRLDEFADLLNSAGYNLGTRTTQAALLGLVYGEIPEEEDCEAVDPDPNQIRYFIASVKPKEVSLRVEKLKKLFSANEIGLTRTTLAACQLIADDFHI